MKKIYCVPMVHTIFEQRSFAKQVEKNLAKNYKEYIENIQNFWQETTALCQKVFLAKTLEKTVVFLENFYDSFSQKEIFSITKKRNEVPLYALVNSMYHQGALIKGAENEKAHKRNAKLAKALLSNPEINDGEKIVREIEKILLKRNFFIAQNIRFFLSNSDKHSAVLFIGALHLKGVFDIKKEPLLETFELIQLEVPNLDFFKSFTF